MLSPTEERIIRRRVRADEAYYKLIAQFSDDARRRLAIHSRSVEIRAELRGDPKPQWEEGWQTVPLWAPLRDAVRAEIKARTPGITIEVAMGRERRRLAIGCGRAQLVLGRFARLRRKLRRIIWQSGLAIRECADAIGVACSTLDAHLAGARPSLARAAWYERLESITVEHEYILIAIRRPPATRKKSGWRTPLPDESSDGLE